MSSKNYAAIDIGSNAVRLLIKKVSRRLRCVRARRNLSGKRRENAPFDESVSPSDEDL